MSFEEILQNKLSQYAIQVRLGTLEGSSESSIGVPVTESLLGYGEALRALFELRVSKLYLK